MCSSPVKSNVPNLVPVQPPVGGAQGPVNNAPVGNPPAAPELPGEDPQAQAPRMPTGELVAKLDSLLARAANNELKRPTNPIKPMDNGFDFKKSETALAKEINQECRFQIHGLFIGDLFRHVYRTGWYK